MVILIDALVQRALSPNQQKIKSLLESGRTEVQICRALRMCEEEIYEQMSAIHEKGHDVMYPAVPQEKIDKARELYAQGCPQKEIAVRLGLSTASMNKYVRDKGPKKVCTAPNFAEMKELAEKSKAPASAATDTGAGVREKDAAKIIPQTKADAKPLMEETKAATAETEDVIIPDAVRQLLRNAIEQASAEAAKLYGAALLLRQRADELTIDAEAAKMFLLQNGGLG